MNRKIYSLFIRKAFLILIVFLVTATVAAQDTPVSTSANDVKEKLESKFTCIIDVVYPYMWRGLCYYGNKIAFQPSLAYAITDKISVGLLGTSNFSGAPDAYHEFD